MSSSRIEKLMMTADADVLAGEWGHAFELMNEACALAPNDPEVYVRLGSYLIQFGYPRERWLPMFDMAARVGQGSASVQTDVGLAYCLAGRLRQASELFRDLQKQQNSPPLASTMLALLFALELRHEEAKDILLATSEAHPADVLSRSLLAQYHLLECSYVFARRVYESILTIKPDHIPARVGLRRLDHAERQHREARGSARRPKGRSMVMIVEDRRIDRRVLDEAMSLQAAGWDMTVIAGEPPDENPFWDEECYPDLRIMRADEWMFTLSCFGKSFKYSIPYYRDRVDAVRSQEHFAKIMPNPQWHKLFNDHRAFYIGAIESPASVYVAHDLPQLPAAAMAALYHGAHLAYDSHELFPEQSFVRKDKHLLSSMEAHLAPMADQITVVNESMVEEMSVRYGVHSEVILNCPSLDASKLPIPRTNRLRDALTIPGGRQILLYQGNIVSRIRNLENVIDGMALLRRDDLALVFMGPDNGGGDELVERANKLGLLGRSVFFHPAVRQSELLSYTVSADAGLIPYTPVDWNTKFCTPNKLYEFIVAELPILANDLPELIRFVGNQGIGVNHPMSCAEEVAHAIESFFGNDVRQYRTCLREVSSRFVWQNHEGPRVVELYEAMALSPARAKDQELIREPRCAELPA